MIVINKKKFIFNLCCDIYGFLQLESESMCYACISLFKCIDENKLIELKFNDIYHYMLLYSIIEDENEKKRVKLEIETSFKAIKNFYFEKKDLELIEKAKNELKNNKDFNMIENILHKYERVLKEEHSFEEGEMYIFIDGTTVCI